MKQFFVRHTILTGIMLLFLLLSIICQIIIGFLYQNMIKETDNMSATENKLLKQCKLKFVNCFQMNAGVSNVPVFVDKFLNRIRFLGITIPGFHHISGQLTLLAVFTGGIGICRGIINGETFTQILPFYILSFLGLYLYFSVTSLVDMQTKRDVLRTNLVDYLENHMVNRLSLNLEEVEKLEKAEQTGKTEDTEEALAEKTEKPIKIKAFGKAEEEELEELLKEFLV